MYVLGWGGGVVHCSAPFLFPHPNQSSHKLSAGCLRGLLSPSPRAHESPGAQLQERLSILTSFVSLSPAAPAGSADQAFPSPQVISFLLESLCSGPKLKPLFPAHFPKTQLSRPFSVVGTLLCVHLSL